MKRNLSIVIASILGGLASGVLSASAAPSAAPQRVLTKENGAPVGDNQHSQSAGPGGSVLLQDFHLIEKLARFDRERVPERVVHARGVGAFGEFVSAGSFAQYTRASMLSQAAKKTPMFVRFSTVVHSQGSPETLRDTAWFRAQVLH